MRSWSGTASEQSNAVVPVSPLMQDTVIVADWPPSRALTWSTTICLSLEPFTSALSK
jgi:hypothetical protein